jgi:hypothetical protein
MTWRPAKEFTQEKFKEIKECLSLKNTWIPLVHEIKAHGVEVH